MAGGINMQNLDIPSKDNLKRWYENILPPKAITDENGNEIREGLIIPEAFWKNKQPGLEIKPLSKLSKRKG